MTLVLNFTTVIVGEIANFAAYAFAPAILVTPLGALSIIIRHEKTQTLHDLIIFIRIFIWLLNINKYQILQCCSCTYYTTRKATHFWNSWLCSMCCGVHHNRSTCSSRTPYWISHRSMGSCHWARYLNLNIFLL